MLVAVQDLEALEQTIAVLSDPVLLRALGEVDAELARGEGEDQESLAAAMRAASNCVSEQHYELVIAPTARRQFTEQLQADWHERKVRRAAAWSEAVHRLRRDRATSGM